MAIREDDPFTKVFNALWELLEEGELFSKVVNKKNTVKYLGSDRDPEKETVSDADFPEIRMFISELTPHVQATSHHSNCMMTVELAIATSEKTMDSSLFPLVWDVYRQMAGWFAKLDALTWGGQKYCKLNKPTGISTGQAESELQRGIQGWSAIWTIEVYMWFNTSIL